MLKELFAWMITFLISLVAARGAAWRIAFQLTMPFPSYDDEAIYNQIKERVFTRMWLLCTIVGSSFVAIAMHSDEFPAVVLILLGAILITTYNVVRGYKLFRIALTELALPWPPRPKV
ncbi:MAG: hypothetical protein ACKOQM_05330 [Novosphingobium sp.]